MENKENYTVDQLFEKLNTVLKKMEDKNISLEESFSCYHEGMTLLSQCKEALDTVEKKVLQLDKNGETHEFQ